MSWILGYLICALAMGIAMAEDDMQPQKAIYSILGGLFWPLILLAKIFHLILKN